MPKGLFKSIITLILAPVFFLVLPLNFNEQQQGAATRPKRRAERGIYLTYYMAQGGERFAYIKEQAKKAGINTIVVDAKYALSRPLLEPLKNRKLNFMTRLAPDPWLARLTNQLHRQGFIVSARLVVFKDDHLVIARPDLGVRMPGGGLYRDRRSGRWADPYSGEVRLFNELVAERAALSGVDEVQFDYIRFPAENESQLAVYPFKQEGASRVAAVNSFLKAARQRLKKYHVSLAVDIFGVTAWQARYDSLNLGQDLKKMAKYIDVLSPMLYPSHFQAGYDGYANPGSHPYHFIYSGVKRALDLLSGESVAVVPWLQGFSLRSPNFGPGYIAAQIQACKDAGVSRYLIWNASNNYRAAYDALQKEKVADQIQTANPGRNPEGL